eukprot:TRINITY_DN1872_c0_g1_i1.p1 TRINITY_DN1872_c0_g1~~TRINITY_DN1872_c0_g1_i1.p1  ORF type:complete len:357 (-),score=55.05 TRINITY_DN1872_c0_g1_i1:222-1292(-)
MSWEGTDPTLPSILLNGHYDVVPAVYSEWKHDPFEAHKDEHGNIYARGTQDMKCVLIQYLEAIRRLKENGFRPLRTINLTFVPDEEIGGTEGMGTFVDTPLFKSLNVGVALDEGLASPGEEMIVYYGERAPWWVRVKATGPAGHGSRFIENTAMEKLIKMVNKALEFRKAQFDTLQRGVHQCGMKLGDVTTLNLTALRGGVTSDGGVTFAYNVIPTEAEAAFDIRIPPTVDLKEFKNTVDGWTSEEGVSWELVNRSSTFIEKNPCSSITDDAHWWQVLKNEWENQGLKIDAQIFPAATDSRFLRDKNIPAFGFSPMNRTPTLLHDHNEFLNQDVFLKGIDIFVKTIKALSSTPRFE